MSFDKKIVSVVCVLDNCIHKSRCLLIYRRFTFQPDNTISKFKCGTHASKVAVCEDYQINYGGKCDGLGASRGVRTRITPGGCLGVGDCLCSFGEQTFSLDFL